MTVFPLIMVMLLANCEIRPLVKAAGIEDKTCSQITRSLPTQGKSKIDREKTQEC